MPRPKPIDALVFLRGYTSSRHQLEVVLVEQESSPWRIANAGRSAAALAQLCARGQFRIPADVTPCGAQFISAKHFRQANQLSGFPATRINPVQAKFAKDERQ
jgi:hypothetical protein